MSWRVTAAVALAAAVAFPGALRAQDVAGVVIETSLGTITAEIYSAAAPLTSQNFLAYVDSGVFDGGSFFRSVRLDNQPDDSVKIDVIQGGPPSSARERLRPPIPLERTTATGLRHLDGTLSMARAGPDSGRSQFFICIGDQPSLDYGGARNPDGQGFAAFGRVVEGMEVVRAIQAGDVRGQRLVEPVEIVRIRRTGPS